MSPDKLRQNLKTAWAALRFQAPGIASKVIKSDDGTSYQFEYSIPHTEKLLDDWIAATLLERPTANNPEELMSSLVNSTEERDKCSSDSGDYVSRLYYSPASGTQGQNTYNLCLFSQHS